MTLIFGAGAVILLSAFVSATNQFHPLSDDFIASINAQQTSWTAGRNFPADTPMASLEIRLGAKKGDTHLPIKKHDSDLIASLPENFDPREKWPHCPSLNEIRDQGCCGSCWAFGAVEAMTDRYCIYSNGTKNFHFSAEDVLTCMDMAFGMGCQGSVPIFAWDYWQSDGIVSGGGYNSSEGCMPYEIPHDCIGNKTFDTPPCKTECRAGYNVEYNNDKHYGKQVYTVAGEDGIKAELFTNGPMEAAFDVYEDFFHYKTGVYHHAKGKLRGGHAVKMLGWGVEGGEKYWLLANSWNSDWGDKGYFKIRRGNECGIEDELTAGEPKLI